MLSPGAGMVGLGRPSLTACSPPKACPKTGGFVNDREFNTQKRRIRAVTRKFGSIGIGWWKLDIAYARHPSDMPDAVKPENADGRWECAASTNVAWQYRDAKITFNMEAAAESDDEELEKRFLHEYAHCLLNEMRSIAKSNDSLVENWIEHEESVATSIANTLMWTYKAGQRDPLKKRKH
jgi:hypothetical protein